MFGRLRGQVSREPVLGAAKDVSYVLDALVSLVEHVKGDLNETMGVLAGLSRPVRSFLKLFAPLHEFLVHSLHFSGKIKVGLAKLGERRQVMVDLLELLIQRLLVTSPIFQLQGVIGLSLLELADHRVEGLNHLDHDLSYLTRSGEPHCFICGLPHRLWQSFDQLGCLRYFEGLLHKQ